MEKMNKISLVLLSLLLFVGCETPEGFEPYEFCDDPMAMNYGYDVEYTGCKYCAHEQSSMLGYYGASQGYIDSVLFGYPGYWNGYDSYGHGSCCFIDGATNENTTYDFLYNNSQDSTYCIFE